MTRVCKVDGCGRPVRARRMCINHYQAWWLSHDVPPESRTHGKHVLPFLARAACVGRDDIDWVPSAETVTTRAARARNLTAALAVCADCPVRDACLAHAVTAVEHGIWGGTVDEQRVELRRFGLVAL